MRSMLPYFNSGALGDVAIRSHMFTPSNAIKSRDAIATTLFLLFTMKPANIIIIPKTVVAIIAFIPQPLKGLFVLIKKNTVQYTLTSIIITHSPMTSRAALPFRGRGLSYLQYLMSDPAEVLDKPPGK